MGGRQQLALLLNRPLPCTLPLHPASQLQPRRTGGCSRRNGLLEKSIDGTEDAGEAGERWRTSCAARVCAAGDARGRGGNSSLAAGE